MASSSPPSKNALKIFIFALTNLSLLHSQLVLNSVEQESVYHLLESLNSAVPWRSLFPDDLCSSAPHGVVCDYATETETATETLHIVELSFGYISDYNPTPTCTPNSTLPDLFTFSTFPHLQKLFFYKCFTHQPVSLPDLSRVGSGVQELVFINNPSLYGSLTDGIRNLTSLRRLIITGTNVSGEIPAGFGELVNLEEVTLSRNRFAGVLSPEKLSKLTKLRVLDLSSNGFAGKVPASIGGLVGLLKLDLSSNGFSGEVPATMKGLTGLELLDLSYNRFVNGGVPLFLANMSKLKGLYLSGNELGGGIPDIWENLRGIHGIGLSKVGLVGGIPISMGVFLESVRYLGLDNNKLTGGVPVEFEKLRGLSELNLNNNNLSGRVPFSYGFFGRVGGKIRVEGNPKLCVDEGVVKSFYKSNGGLGKVNVCNKVEYPKYALVYKSSSSTRTSDHICFYIVVVWSYVIVVEMIYFTL